MAKVYKPKTPSEYRAKEDVEVDVSEVKTILTKTSLRDINNRISNCNREIAMNNAQAADFTARKSALEAEKVLIEIEVNKITIPAKN